MDRALELALVGGRDSREASTRYRTVLEKHARYMYRPRP
jgi:hypothetical protein